MKFKVRAVLEVEIDDDVYEREGSTYEELLALEKETLEDRDALTYIVTLFDDGYVNSVEAEILEAS